VRVFSYGVVIRPSISCGERPVYCHAIETTGMSISGKMSVGVRRMMTGAASRIRIDNTMNVYGLSSARRTIHMPGSPGD
jgi:hypothetical protein